MNLNPTSKIGSKGEQMACDFLETRGHHILDRNWRGGHLELDIVSEAPDGVHFVEVKARTAPAAAPMEKQVTPVKQKRITAAASQYLTKNHLQGKEVYFDVVSVLFDGTGAMVQYYPQAWIPMFA